MPTLWGGAKKSDPPDPDPDLDNRKLTEDKDEITTVTIPTDQSTSPPPISLEPRDPADTVSNDNSPSISPTSDTTSRTFVCPTPSSAESPHEADMKPIIKRKLNLWDITTRCLPAILKDLRSADRNLTETIAAANNFIDIDSLQISYQGCRAKVVAAFNNKVAEFREAIYNLFKYLCAFWVYVWSSYWFLSKTQRATLKQVSAYELDAIIEVKNCAADILSEHLLCMEFAGFHIELAASVRVILLKMVYFRENLMPLTESLGTAISSKYNGDAEALARDKSFKAVSDLCQWTNFFFLEIVKKPQAIVTYDRWTRLFEHVNVLIDVMEDAQDEMFHTFSIQPVYKTLKDVKTLVQRLCRWLRVPIKVIAMRTADSTEQKSAENISVPYRTWDLLTRIIKDGINYKPIMERLEPGTRVVTVTTDSGIEKRITSLFGKLSLEPLDKSPQFYDMITSEINSEKSTDVTVALMKNVMIICSSFDVKKKKLYLIPRGYYDCSVNFKYSSDSNTSEQAKVELNFTGQPAFKINLSFKNGDDMSTFTSEINERIHRSEKFNNLELQRITEDLNKDRQNLVSHSQRLSKAKKRFQEKYVEKRVLHNTIISRVTLSTRKSDNKLVVCKTISAITAPTYHTDKKTGREYPLEFHIQQILSQSTVRSVATVQFYEDFELPLLRYVMVMEYAGDQYMSLYRHRKKYGPYSEEIANFIFVRCWSAVMELHHVGYFHHDIKDHNFLISKTTLQIKIIDFGSCIPTTTANHQTYPSTQYRGTEIMKSPEVYQTSTFSLSNQETWYMGCLYFCLLLNSYPFGNAKEIVGLSVGQVVMGKGGYVIGDDNDGTNGTGTGISKKAKTALEHMLQKDPTQRVEFDKIIRLSVFGEYWRELNYGSGMGAAGRQGRGDWCLWKKTLGKVKGVVVESLLRRRRGSVNGWTRGLLNGLDW
ncbi:ATP-dependent Lon protease pim1 [Blyttiomyces sp. JEL0837]|nr:ATP-dependent Lon protease pim1 [Blyttiomyces sp. JEL0837]